MEQKSFYQRLIEVQRRLRAPKNAYNSFGKYNYRSAEDILEGVKSLLSEAGLLLILSDSVEVINGRFYIKATATVSDGEQSVSASAYAREDETKAGMNGAQITGSTSSYARKYALGGLLLVDDGKDVDSDSYNAGAGAGSKSPPSYQNAPPTPSYQPLRQSQPSYQPPSPQPVTPPKPQPEKQEPPKPEKQELPIDPSVIPSYEIIRALDWLMDFAGISEEAMLRQAKRLGDDAEKLSDLSRDTSDALFSSLQNYIIANGHAEREILEKCRYAQLTREKRSSE